MELAGHPQLKKVIVHGCRNYEVYLKCLTVFDLFFKYLNKNYDSK